MPESLIKSSLLKWLLTICDDSVLYEEVLVAGDSARRGYKRISYCCKAHLLNDMELILPIWAENGKYAKGKGWLVKG